MARHKSMRSQLYRAARDLGNVQAAAQGPSAYAKRAARRKISGPSKSGKPWPRFTAPCSFAKRENSANTV